MKVTCQACGATNSSGAELCDMCGLPLQGGSPATVSRRGEPGPSTIGATSELSATSTKQADTEPETAPSTVTCLSTRFSEESPVELALQFSQVLVAGHPAEVMLQVRNISVQPLKRLEITLSCRGFQAPIPACLESLQPDQSTSLMVTIAPVQPGPFILWCQIRLRGRDQFQALAGRRPIRINAAPPNSDRLPDLRDVHTNLDVNEAEPQAEGYCDASLSKFAEPGTIHTLEELLHYKLPEKLQPLPVSQDYHLSLSVANSLSVPQSKRLVIPRQFRRYVQPGSVLNLVPANPEVTRAIQLVARPEFKIGRSRKRADLITWFLPFNPANDDKTQHISKVHVIAKCEEGRLLVRDEQSKCGSSLDGSLLPVLDWEPVEGRVLLALADEYFLDVQPLDSACPDGPDIVNLSLWPGPETAVPARNGCVTFTPIEMELAHHNAIWLFTDASFGRSRINPVHFNVEGLEAIQGRFHFFRGCFWLENLVQNFAIHINSVAVNAREIVPLIDGLDLRIGNVNFRVEILA